jgi:hypothetical protein
MYGSLSAQVKSRTAELGPTRAVKVSALRRKWPSTQLDKMTEITRTISWECFEGIYGRLSYVLVELTKVATVCDQRNDRKRTWEFQDA